MEPLISIIVPVYKVEPYLRKCVDSILNQTYRNLEIILVDDGSPDNCGAICDAYAKQDQRVKVIHKDNGGLSIARNIGMAAATGKYLSFLDSDDIFPPAAMETLLNALEAEDAQIAIGSHLRFSDVPPDDDHANVFVHCMSKTEAMEDMLKNGCASWARLYHRSVHSDVLFPDGEINEDEAVVLRLLDKCDRIVKTTAVVYYYRCRPESITTVSFHPKKLIWVQHCRDNLHYVETRHPELVPFAAARYRGSLLWALRELSLLGQGMEDAWHSLRRELRSMIFGIRRKDLIRGLLLAYLPRRLLKELLQGR